MIMPQHGSVRSLKIYSVHCAAGGGGAGGGGAGGGA